MSNDSVAAAIRDQRREARRPVAAEVEVTDANTGAFVGYLVNLSSEGLMLVGEVEVLPSSVFQFRISLPEPVGGLAELLVGVESLWCQRGEDPRHFWCGFQIIDIAPEHREVLGTLIESL